MNRIEEIQREIESVRSELNESFLQNDEFEEYYRKSTELDKLIEEYLERTIGQRYYRSFFVQQISNITAKSRWKIKEILDFFLRVV